MRVSVTAFVALLAGQAIAQPSIQILSTAPPQDCGLQPGAGGEQRFVGPMSESGSIFAAGRSLRVGGGATQKIGNFRQITNSYVAQPWGPNPCDEVSSINGVSRSGRYLYGSSWAQFSAIAQLDRVTLTVTNTLYPSIGGTGDVSLYVIEESVPASDEEISIEVANPDLWGATFTAFDPLMNIGGQVAALRESGSWLLLGPAYYASEVVDFPTFSSVLDDSSLTGVGASESMAVGFSYDFAAPRAGWISRAPYSTWSFPIETVASLGTNQMTRSHYFTAVSADEDVVIGNGVFAFSDIISNTNLPQPQSSWSPDFNGTNHGFYIRVNQFAPVFAPLAYPAPVPTDQVGNVCTCPTLAKAVSSTGCFIGGVAINSFLGGSQLGFSAAFWTPNALGATGYLLQDYLSSTLGISVPGGWHLQSIDRVSDDGTTLAGIAYRVNPVTLQDEHAPWLLSGFSAPISCVFDTNPLVCDTTDFNNDGVFPDPQDLADFVAVLGGATPDPAWGDLDFNNDGVSPSDEDLAAFISRLGGGDCTN